MKESITLLRRCGIQPTPQRVAIVDSVAGSTAHPTADEVYASARRRCSTISRATVYNTLSLLVDRNILRTQILKEGTVVYDPNVARHHHFIDDESGTIIDIPWDKLVVKGKENLHGLEIRDFQVVLRGRKKK
ncbi:MAG TPA: Fur family transcriptional regulator [Bacteroidota bacterium]|nr:Fur family transcriptional regulator [Bacteroidota bacterium]